MRVKEKFNDYSDSFNYGSTNIGKKSSFNIKNIIDLTYLKEKDYLKIIVKVKQGNETTNINGKYSSREWGHGYYNAWGTYVDMYELVFKQGQNEKQESISQVNIYMPNEEANFNRIKKAFDRLKELCQDEKDPFDD